MKRLTRYLRLLPAVVIVGTGLLVLKGVDIARAAQADSVADPDGPDNSGLAPATNADAPAAPDFANGGDPSSSAAEVDVLSSLAHRRAELDARERALNMRENVLNAGEARVDQKIAALKQLQGRIQGLLADRDDKQKAQIASLVKTYGPDGMPAKRAAAIFNTMPDDVLVPIAKAMKPGDLGPILAAMNPDLAQKLTVKLSALLKLPETAPGAMCPPAATPTADATPPSTNPLAATITPPLQIASAAPPPAQTPPAATPAPPPSPAATPPAPQTQAAATPAPAPTPKKPIPHRATPPKPAPVKPAPPKPVAASNTPPSTTPPAAKPPTVAAPTGSSTPASAPAPAPASTPKPAPAAATPPATPKPPAASASGPPTQIGPPSGG